MRHPRHLPAGNIDVTITITCDITNYVKQTLQVKLSPTPAQHAALLQTMEQFNAACTWMAQIAFREKCTSKVDLQKLVYYDVREHFKLSAQMTIRAIAKVIEAYRRDPQIQVSFRPHGAMTYDERICSFPGPDRVSLLTLDGREILPIVFGSYQRERIDRKKGQADLVYRGRTFYLLLTTDLPEPDPQDATDWIGVDLGIVQIATDSDGNQISGSHINNVRARYSKLRGKLQKKGTPSAKRLLKKRSGKEQRFTTDTNHCISKRLVSTAKGTTRGIALENLRHIRTRATVKGKRQRRVLHSWKFGQLQDFVAYKAQREGVQVRLVNPAYTSQECSECGHTERGNRPSQQVFTCLSCGFSTHADKNAALVIRRRAMVI